MPTSVLKKLFPPIVTGTAMMLIGGGLIGAGVKYVGGGVFCGENDFSRVPRFGGPQLCNENGAVTLPFGDAAYVGLGGSVILCSIFIQVFGSPFLKSTFLFWSLIFGCIVSGFASYTAKPGDKVMCAAEPDNLCIGGFANAVVGKTYSFWDWDAVTAAPMFTFNWVHTFPLGFAPEYLFPILIGYFVSAAETVGDISMSCAASQIP